MIEVQIQEWIYRIRLWSLFSNRSNQQCLKKCPICRLSKSKPHPTLTSICTSVYSYFFSFLLRSSFTFQRIVNSCYRCSCLARALEHVGNKQELVEAKLSAIDLLLTKFKMYKFCIQGESLMTSLCTFCFTGIHCIYFIEKTKWCKKKIDVNV